MEHIRIIRPTLLKKMRRSLGRRSTEEICMGYWNISLEFCTLLHSPPRAIYRSDGVTSDDSSLRYPQSYSGKYSKWCPDSCGDESNYIRLCPVYHIHVVGVSRRILCRMSYLCMARPKRVDEGTQMTELSGWCL